MNVFIVEMCGETPEAHETREGAAKRCLAYVHASGYYAKVHHDGEEIMSFYARDDGSIMVSMSHTIDAPQSDDATSDTHLDKVLN